MILAPSPAASRVGLWIFYILLCVFAYQAGRLLGKLVGRRKR